MALCGPEKSVTKKEKTVKPRHLNFCCQLRKPDFVKYLPHWTSSSHLSMPDQRPQLQLSHTAMVTGPPSSITASDAALPGDRQQPRTWQAPVPAGPCSHMTSQTHGLPTSTSHAVTAAGRDRAPLSRPSSFWPMFAECCTFCHELFI